MSVGNYALVRTYVDGDILNASDYTADHQNHITNQNPIATGAYSDSITQMRSTTNPGDVNSESLAGTLAGELERIRFCIQQIKTALNGSTVVQWYTTQYAVTVPNSSVTTAKLANGATFVQYLRTVASGANVTTAETVLVTQAISLTRGKVRLKGTHGGFFVTNTTPFSATFTLRLKRGATLVASADVAVSCPNGTSQNHNYYDSIEFIDQPGAGTYTYTLVAILTGVTGDSSFSFNNSVLSLEEVA
jgi:hypothetical protein